MSAVVRERPHQGQNNVPFFFLPVFVLFFWGALNKDLLNVICRTWHLQAE